MDISNFPDGVLSSAQLQSLIDYGALSGAQQARLQPASLDLSFSARAWRLRASFLPSKRRRVSERLDDGLSLRAIDLSNGAVFERGCVYLVELNEALSLPTGIIGAANPKSSTGRIDVFVRLVTDYGVAFDAIGPEYKGPLYAEVSPRSFSILVHEGSSLNQLRLKKGSFAMSDAQTKSLHNDVPLVYEGASTTTPDIAGGLGLSVALTRNSLNADGLIGWRARRHTALIEVDKPGVLPPEDFFEPIYEQRAGFIVLDPDEFYILASKESLVIPPDTAAEMTPISPGLGEFRVHYAGFFDPGFGWSGDSSDTAGSRAVLEVRSHDAPFALEDGQLVARLVYEKMSARPGRLYGADIKSNYQGQTLKLSKHFRDAR